MKARCGLPTKPSASFLGVVVVIALGLLSPSRASADINAINVSGYETFPGLPCQLDDGGDGQCRVSFRGWVGGAGPVADGWASYTGEGKVVVRVNYTGDPGFGQSVTITGGSWRLTQHGTLYAGTFSGGTVTWPVTTEDLGCGVAIARVESDLVDLSNSGFSQFLGCLHDFNPDDEIAIPPQIWGVFQ